MKFIDLFAGIGGFRLGMEQAGHECVGWVEWDKFARKAYQAIFMKKEWNAYDIRSVRFDDIPKSDCWCFGFPCQDISVAGKQQGITDGKRSSLFFTVTQLIRNTPKENRPIYLFIENVKNLLSINRGFDFLKLQIELDEIGYDLEWSILDSAEFVPQHRERLFIIGHLRGRCTKKVFPIGQSCQEAFEANRPSTNTLTTRYPESQGTGSYLIKSKSKINQVGNVSNSDSFNMNPQTGRVYSPDGISPTLSTMQGGSQEPKIIQRARGKNHGGIKPIAPTLSTHSYQDNNLCVDGYSIRKLTPLECWRLQGFPDWAFNRAKEAGLSDSQLYKQAGNTVTVPVIKSIGEQMEVS